MGWEQGDRVANDAAAVKELKEENVDAKEAFDVLIDELGAALELVKKEGMQAIQQDQFTKAQAAAQRAEVLSKYLKGLEGLREKWQAMLSGATRDKLERRKSKRTHLSPGIRTPNRAYRIPILEALLELGGSARSRDVLTIVESKMKSKFRAVDYEQTQGRRVPRWRNAAEWERNTMKNEGLISADSPTGIWEITQEGRAYLRENAESLPKQGS